MSEKTEQGRFYCTYKGIRFYGKTEEEAIKKREEYKTKEEEEQCRAKKDST